MADTNNLLKRRSSLSAISVNTKDGTRFDGKPVPVIPLKNGINALAIVRDLRTPPELRSIHAIRNIQAEVLELPFFKNLKSGESIRSIVSCGVYLKFRAHTVVYRELDVEDGLYIVLSGSCRAVKQLPQEESSGGEGQDAQSPVDVSAPSSPIVDPGGAGGKAVKRTKAKGKRSPKRPKTTKAKRARGKSPAGKPGSPKMHMMSAGLVARRFSLTRHHPKHELFDEREVEDSDDGYEIVSQYGPGDVFGSQERMDKRADKRRGLTIKATTDVDLMFIKHDEYELIMQARIRHLAYNVQTVARNVRNDQNVSLLEKYIVQGIPFLADMTEKSRKTFIKRAHFKYMEANGIVLPRGSKAAYVYLCLNGAVRQKKSLSIRTQAPDGSDVGDSWYFPGDIVALSEMLNEVVCEDAYVTEQPSLFMHISRDDYYDLFQSKEEQLKKQQRDWLRGLIPGIRKFNAGSLNSLAALFQRKTFRGGEILLREDKFADFVFFLVEGECYVSKDIVGDVLPKRQVRLASLLPGSYCGMMSCYYSEVSPETVVTRGPTVCMCLAPPDLKRFPKDQLRNLVEAENVSINSRGVRHKSFQKASSSKLKHHLASISKGNIGNFKMHSTNPSHRYHAGNPALEREKKRLGVSKQANASVEMDVDSSLKNASFYSPLRGRGPHLVPSFATTSKLETYNPHFRPCYAERASSGKLKANKFQERLKTLGTGPKPMELRNVASILTKDYLRSVIDLSKVVPPTWLDQHSGTIHRHSMVGKPKKLPKVHWSDEDKVRLYYADTKRHKKAAKERRDHIRAFANVNPDTTHATRQRIKDTIRPGFLKWIDP